MGCIISLFRYGTFWPPVVPHAANRAQRAGNDPDTIAATKIQAGFRGYKTRQELQKAAKSKLTDEEIARRLKPPLSTIKEEEEAAAVKIQAGVRGYLTRKRIKQSLDYSFDDGFGMGSIDGELSASATPEPPHEMPIAADIQSVLPKSVSPALSVQSEVTTPVQVIDEPAPVVEEEIAKVETLPVTSAAIEPVSEPVLPVQEASLPAAVVEEAKPVSELQKQEDIYEIGMLDEAPVDGPNHLESSLANAELEPDFQYIDSEEVILPANSELVPEIESITTSKSAELSSLPLAQVGVNKLIGVFETPNPEPTAVPGIQQSEPQIPAKVAELPSTQTQPQIPAFEAKPDQEPQILPQEVSHVEASDPPASDPAEPPVQRRSSKRKMKAGTEKYRSGIVIQNEVPVAEQMHIPSLEEIDAEIEAEMMNNAAAKIQAGFRGFQVRKGLNQAATRIQSNYRGYKTRKELKDKALAAVKIQATVRGFLARRRIYKIKYQQQRRKSSARRRSSATQNQLRSQAQLKQSIEAATRIQAAYRGYIVRSKKREPEALQ